MNYKIVKSGTSKEVTLDRLSRNLNPQSEVYSIQEDGEIYLGMISHKTLVFFAVEFAHYTLKNYAKKKSPKAEICISLVRKWIDDDTSVSSKELTSAAYAADAAAAADAADAAAAAAAAADAACAAAYAAADAAYAAAAGKDKEMEFKRQGKFILDFLKSGKHLFSM
jgi:hypothetical protein